MKNPANWNSSFAILCKTIVNLKSWVVCLYCSDFFLLFIHLNFRLYFRIFRLANEILEFCITILFIWSLLTICSSLLFLQFCFVEYQIEFQMHLIDGMIDFNQFLFFLFSFFSQLNHSTIELITFSFQVFWSFVCVLLACEIGEMIASQLNAFNDKLFRCDWYLLSVDMRRMYLTTLANAQQSTSLQAFGTISCTRESFKKVQI